MNTKKHIKGQSIVEFSLTLPILLLIFFTFLDLGRAVYYYSALGNAVREGARYASVHKLNLQSDADDQAEVEAIIQNYSVALTISADKITFPVPTQGDDYVTVQVEYDFDPIVPFLTQLAGGEDGVLTLQSESTMLLAPIARN